MVLVLLAVQMIMLQLQRISEMIQLQKQDRILRYNKELSIQQFQQQQLQFNTGLIGDTNEFTFESALPDAIIVPGVKQKRQTVVNMSWG